jgi:hypothetical protein
MKIRFISSIALSLALAAVLTAQNASPAPPVGQTPPQVPGPGDPLGLGWRAGAVGRLTETGMGGRGVQGTVTAVTPGYYAVKTEAGETYMVNYSANTRFLRQVVPRQGEKVEAPPASGERGNRQRPAPEPIKSTDIKIGDEIAALGEIDPSSRSVGAVVVMLVDPERAKLMHEQRANFGKTWLMGKVTGINEATVSLTGALDNAAHAFTADENTTFRKHREPITLADIQLGDVVRVEGAMKDSNFIATSVAVMGMPQGGGASVPQAAPPAPAASQPK